MSSIGCLKEMYYDLNKGRVDYQTMKTSEEYTVYTAICEELKAFDPATLTTREEQTAFRINLYNTIVIHGIVELGINSSVKEITNFFKSIAYQIGEFFFSADDMEHGILRANARPPPSHLPAFQRQR